MYLLVYRDDELHFELFNKKVGIDVIHKSSGETGENGIQYQYLSERFRMLNPVYRQEHLQVPGKKKSETSALYYNRSYLNLNCVKRNKI